MGTWFPFVSTNLSIQLGLYDKFRSWERERNSQLDTNLRQVICIVYISLCYLYWISWDHCRLPRFSSNLARFVYIF